MQIATVRYQIATYSGSVRVVCDENDDVDDIIVMARRELIRESGGISLPFGYQGFVIVSRDSAEQD